MGTTIPERISATVIIILTIPFSFIVVIVIMGYRTDNAVTKREPIVSEIAKIIKLFKETGNPRPYGAGNKEVTKIRGKNLKVTLDNLCPSILKYHIKYKSFGLANS